MGIFKCCSLLGAGRLFASGLFATLSITNVTSLNLSKIWILQNGLGGFYLLITPMSFMLFPVLMLTLAQDLWQDTGRIATD